MDSNELRRILREIEHDKNERIHRTDVGHGIGVGAKWLLILAVCFVVALTLSSELSGCSDTVHRASLAPMALVPVVLAAGFFLFLATIGGDS